MKLTPEKLVAFCAVLAETCQVRKACAAIDVSPYTAYKWRKDLPEFAEQWDEALAAGKFVLESEAHRRAFEGTEKPVYQGGAMVGTITEYSDTLAIFLLKAHDPAKYRENTRMELTGADGGPVQMDDKASAARLAQLLAMAQSRKDDASDLLGDE